jgi:hypothetical protein
VSRGSSGTGAPGKREITRRSTTVKGAESHTLSTLNVRERGKRRREKKPHVLDVLDALRAMLQQVGTYRVRCIEGKGQSVCNP